MTRAELEAVAGRVAKRSIVIASAIITLLFAFATWAAFFGLNNGITGKPWQLALVAVALSIAGFRSLRAHAKEMSDD